MASGLIDLSYSFNILTGNYLQICGLAWGGGDGGGRGTLISLAPYTITGQHQIHDKMSPFVDKLVAGAIQRAITAAQSDGKSQNMFIMLTLHIVYKFVFTENF